MAWIVEVEYRHALVGMLADDGGESIFRTRALARRWAKRNLAYCRRDPDYRRINILRVDWIRETR